MNCSFCGRPEEEIDGFLIKAPLDSYIAICDRCVRECQRIVDDHKAGEIFKRVRESAFAELWGSDH